MATTVTRPYANGLLSLGTKVYQTAPQHLQDRRQRITKEVIALRDVRDVHLVGQVFDAMRARAQI